MSIFVCYIPLYIGYKLRKERIISMKKVISLLMSFVMLLSVASSVSISAFADESETPHSFSVQCGDNAYFNYDLATETVSITGTGDMWAHALFYREFPRFYSDGERVDGNWRQPYYKYVKSIVIGDGITKIDYQEFSGYESVTSVSIADSVKEICWDSFRYCSSLKEIKLPKNLEIIGVDAFNNCTSLEEITIPASVYFIDRVPFRGSENIKSYNVDSSNKNFTSVNGVLYDKQKTTIVRYPSSSTATEFTIGKDVKEIYNGAFEGAKNIKKFKVEKGNTNFVTVNGVLYSKDLTRLVAYPPADSSVTEFAVPQSVTSIDLGAFSQSKYLKKVYILPEIKEIKMHTFYNCSNLEEVYFSKTINYVSENAFDKCNVKTAYIASDGITFDKLNGGIYNAEKVYNYVLDMSNIKVNTTVDSQVGGDNGNNDGNQDSSSGGSDPSAPSPTPAPGTSDNNVNNNTTNSNNNSSTQNQPKFKRIVLNNIKAQKKGVVVAWDAAKNVTGYQLQLATDKKFKKNKKTITVTNKKVTKKTVKKLKSKKKYYVRVRAYKKQNGKRTYSSWSKTKSFKTK